MKLDLDYSDETRLRVQKNVKRLIKQAGEAFDAAIILHENDKYEYACRFMRDSIRFGVDSGLAIYEIFPESDEIRVQEWKKLNQRTRLLDASAAAVIPEILRLEEKLENKTNAQQYAQLIQKCGRVLYQLRETIESALTDELATPEQKDIYQQQDKRRKRLYTGILLGVAAAVGILFAIHARTTPQYNYHEHAQIYWKSNDSDWGEEHSRLFKYEVNGEFQEHTIELEEAVRMTGFRFDPTTRQITEFELDRIQLIDSRGKIKMEYEFNERDPKWVKNKSTTIRMSEGIWTIRPQSDDSYLISPDFPEAEVKVIRIRSRAVDEIPFLYWLLGGQRI